MLNCALGWLIGTLLAQGLPALPASGVPGIVTLIGGLALLVARRDPLRRRYWLVVAAAAFAFSVSVVRSADRLAEWLPETLEARPLHFTGSVVGLPAQEDYGLRFDVEVDPADRQQQGLPSRVRLTAYFKEQAPALLPHAGDRWQWTARLKRPHGTYNPSGFDAEAWLLQEGIGATGSVSLAHAQRLPDRCETAVCQLHALRERLRARLQSTLRGNAQSGLIIALALGDQNGISDADWQRYRLLGLIHLVSISGLHITLFAWLAMRAIQAIWRRNAWLASWRPAGQAAWIGGLIAATAYTLLSGCGIPALRTLVMLWATGVTILAGRGTRPSLLLAVALLAVLAYDPWAVWNVGFWLSFGAVALLVWQGGGRIGRIGRWREAVGAQSAMLVGMLPGMALFFGGTPLVAPLANAIAIPILSLGVTPLALGSLFWSPLAYPAAWLAALNDAILSPLTRFNTIWVLPTPTTVPLCLGLIGAIWWLAPRGIPGRTAAPLLLLPLIWPLQDRPAEGDLRATILDVGQGLAVHLQTAHHDLLFDAGPGKDPTRSAGARVVVPYLHGQGITRLDGLVISHNDLDHSGGAPAVIADIRVDWLLHSLPADQPLLHQVNRVQACQAGQRWNWDGVRFDVLWPTPQGAAASRNDNGHSCVIRVQASQQSLLLTADLEREQESTLLSMPSAPLRSTVLVVPHHGSKTSSGEDFLAAVAPKAAIFPVGYRNAYRHPHPTVWARYEGLDIPLYRTDRDGATVLRLENGSLKLDSWRQLSPRYWHAGHQRDAGPGS